MRLATGFTHDGKLVAEGDERIRLWDVSTGKLVRTLSPHPRGVWSVAFSPNGSILVLTHPGPIFLCDAFTGKEIRRFTDPEGKACSVAFSPDGKTLVSTERDGSVRFWNAATGKEVRRLDSNAEVFSSAAFSPDGKKLVLGSESGAISFWDVATGKEIQPPERHRGEVTLVNFAPDGGSLVTASKDGTVRSWETVTSRQLTLLEHPDMTSPFFLSGKGDILASGGTDGKVRLLHPATGKKIRGFEHPTRPSFALSLDGSTLALWQDKASFWHVGTGRKVGQIEKGRDPDDAFALSPDGKLFASEDGWGIYLWDVATGKKFRLSQKQGRFNFLSGKYGSAWFLTFSPDGKLLACGGENQSVRLWEVVSGKELGWKVKHPRRDTTSVTDEPFCVTFSRDGRTLATGGYDHSVRLWDIATAKEIGRFTGHEDEIRSLAFSSDGKRLASGSDDTTALVWDVAPLLAQRRSPESRFSPSELQALWTTLGSEDATKAFAARWKLVAAPRQAVPFLKDHLRPVAPADAERIQKLIADLGSDDYQRREKATTELEALRELTEPALAEVLRNSPSAEVRQRANRLHDKLLQIRFSPPLPYLQTLRAIEVLEHIETADARKVLETIAAGALEARLTQEARKSLERLADRLPSKP